MTQVAAKITTHEGTKEYPQYRFNIKTIDIWHELEQDVNLRHIFNDLVTSEAIQFIKHVFMRNDKLYVATKCPINDNPDNY